MSVPVRMTSRSESETNIGTEQREWDWGICGKEQMVGMHSLGMRQRCLRLLRH